MPADTVSLPSPLGLYLSLASYSKATAVTAEAASLAATVMALFWYQRTCPPLKTVLFEAPSPLKVSVLLAPFSSVISVPLA